MSRAPVSMQRRISATRNVDANFVVYAVALWAAVLAAIFFSQRGSDVGRVFAFVAKATKNFDGFRPSELGNVIAGAICAALVVLSWIGLGAPVSALLRAEEEQRIDAKRQTSNAWDWAVRCAWGAGVSSLLWFFFGLLHLYVPALALVPVVAGLGLLGWAYARSRRQSSLPTSEAPSYLSLTIAAIPIALAAIASAAPPIAKDALLYHISLPKAFVSARGIVDVPNNIAQFYALAAELNGTGAMLLGRLLNQRVGEVAFTLVEFSYLPLLALLLFGWARNRGLSRAQAILPVALVTCVPTVFASASSAYNDLALCVYVTLAIAIATDWWKAPTARKSTALGLALGLALGVKLLALFVLAPVLIMFLLRLRTAEQESESEFSVGVVLRSTAIALLVTILVAAPWYIQTWLRTGSPVYPFYINIFGGSAPGWDVERSYIDQMLNARYGGYPKSLFDYLLVPFRVSLTAQPEIPKYFDGVIGLSFLVGLPLVFVALRRKQLDSAMKWAAGFAATWFVCWTFSSEQLRYLLPALPALAIVLTESALKIDQRLRKVLWATVFPGLLVLFAWFMSQNPVPVVLGSETRDSYLRRQLDYFPYYEVINAQLPAESRVWLIDMRRDTYHIERPYVSDFRIEDHTFVQMVRASENVEQLRQRAREAGITHVLARVDLVLNPAISPVVDDRLPAAENERKMGVAREFLLGGNLLKHDSKFVLLKL